MYWQKKACWAIEAKARKKIGLPQPAGSVDRGQEKSVEGEGRVMRMGRMRLRMMGWARSGGVVEEGEGDQGG